jgi:hypothetical protein
MPRTNQVSKSARVRELLKLKEGLTPADIAKKVGCTVGLVYNVKSRGELAKGPLRRSKRAATATLGLGGLAESIRQIEKEHAHLRAVLQRVADAIAKVL